MLAGLYYDQCYGCFFRVPILWQYCLVLAGGRRRIGYVGVAAHLARHLSLASLQVFTPLIGHEPSRKDRHEPSADASAQYPVTAPCDMPHHGAEYLFLVSTNSYQHGARARANLEEDRQTIW